MRPSGSGRCPAVSAGRLTPPACWIAAGQTCLAAAPALITAG